MCRSHAEGYRRCPHCSSALGQLEANHRRTMNRIKSRVLRETVANRYPRNPEIARQMAQMNPNQCAYFVANLAASDPELGDQLSHATGTLSSSQTAFLREQTQIATNLMGMTPEEQEVYAATNPGIDRAKGRGITEDDRDIRTFDLSPGSAELPGLYHSNLASSRADVAWDRNSQGKTKREQSAFMDADGNLRAADPRQSHDVANQALYQTLVAQARTKDKDLQVSLFGGDPDTDPEAAALQAQYRQLEADMRNPVRYGAFGPADTHGLSAAEAREKRDQYAENWSNYLGAAGPGEGALPEEIDAVSRFSNIAEDSAREAMYDVADVTTSRRSVPRGFTTSAARNLELDAVLTAREQAGESEVEVAEGMKLIRDADTGGARLRISTGGEDSVDFEYQVPPGTTVGQAIDRCPKIDSVSVDSSKITENAAIPAAARQIAALELGGADDARSKRLREDIARESVLNSLASTEGAGGIGRGNTSTAAVRTSGALRRGAFFTSESVNTGGAVASDLYEVRRRKHLQGLQAAGVNGNNFGPGFSLSGTPTSTLTAGKLRSYRRDYEPPMITEAGKDGKAARGSVSNSMRHIEGLALNSDGTISDAGVDDFITRANSARAGDGTISRGASPDALAANDSLHRLGLDTAASRANYAAKRREQRAQGIRPGMPGYMQAQATATTRVSGSVVFDRNEDGTVSPSEWIAGSSTGSAGGRAAGEKVEYVFSGSSVLHSGADRAVISPDARYVESRVDVGTDGRKTVYMVDAGDVADDLARA